MDYDEFRRTKAELMEEFKPYLPGGVRAYAIEFEYHLATADQFALQKVTTSGAAHRMIDVRCVTTAALDFSLIQELECLWLKTLSFRDYELHYIHEEPDYITLEFITCKTQRRREYVTGRITVRRKADEA